MPWFILMLLIDFFINCKKVFLHLYETESILVLASLALETNLHLNGICVSTKASQYGHGNTLFLFYKNIFYKNIEAEICEILRIYFKNKPEAEIVKRI